MFKLHLFLNNKQKNFIFFNLLLNNVGKNFYKVIFTTDLN